MAERIDKRTLRGILMLIPLLAVLGWIIWQASGVKPKQNTGSESRFSDNNTKTVELFEFDPNEATYEDFRKLGLDARTAAGIVKYRTRGKVFEIAEDFATCYGVTDSIYTLLKPYIVIGQEYRVKPFNRYSRGNNTGRTKANELTLTPFDPNVLSAEEFQRLGFSPRQAEVIVNYRAMTGGFKSADEFAKCYVVSAEHFEQLLPYITIAAQKKAVSNTDLNTMDSTEMVAIRGIGGRSAQEIILYRRRLGGFARMEQLADLKIITERNYELIVQQIWVDTAQIQKININFATPKQLGQHPYIGERTLRKVLQGRQLKGGWRTIEEMIEQNILSQEEAQRLAPYVVFNQN